MFKKEPTFYNRQLFFLIETEEEMIILVCATPLILETVTNLIPSSNPSPFKDKVIIFSR
jgi:hypothetical protein